MCIHRMIPNPKHACAVCLSETTKSLETATETKHPWHHSVDTKHYALYVKFEVRFVTVSRLREKSCPTKSDTFSWGMVSHFY
jgi:hypothetical protein